MNADANRILIVDDAAADREACRRGIRRLPGYDYVFFEAETGEEGLRLCFEESADCVLLDYQLPDMDGLEFLDQLQEIMGEKGVPPVVMLTGQGSEPIAVQALKRGAQDYLVKGVEYGELSRAVLAAVEKVALRRRVEDQRRQLERGAALLKESEELFRTLAENAPVLIWMVETGGRPIFFNRRWLEFRGCGIAEESFDSAMEATHPEDRRRYFDVYLAAEQARRPFALEYRLLHAKGSYRPVFAQGTPRFRPDGTFAGYICFTTDLSEIKHLEERNRQAQRLESIGRLAGGIAHDFNNLLTIVTGYTSVLTAQFPAGDATRAMLEEIAKAGDRAAALTYQLLAFSRKQLLQPRVIDLNAIVKTMEKTLRELLGEGVELTLTLDPHIGRVKVDAGQIEQILMNLALNARDAMPEPGRFTLRTGNVELDEKTAETMVEGQAGAYVLLSVGDTGIGMDPATRALIFEPFFTTKGLKKGTGLGLATVYGIVKQSGGLIDVSSAPGEGTTFRLYFPRQADQAQSSANEKP